MAESINPIDVHKPLTTLVSLENTANRGGGSCYELNDIQEIRKVCLDKNLSLHLDGARLFNALVAKNESPLRYGEVFNSISICLSKGLGAPVGSVLIGDTPFIQKARRIRKVFGGGMRQAGILAAAGIYALENHIARLAIDHEHARLLAAAWSKKSFIGEIYPVETNIVIFEVANSYTAPQLAVKLKEHDILAIAISPKMIRMVVHLDIHELDVERTLDVIGKL